jgi:Single-stranded DNA-specific exonuclease
MGVVEDIAQAAEIIQGADTVTVISHIDADGVSSASVICEAIRRENIPVTPVFIRQLEPLTMKHVPDDTSLKLFTDLGGGQQNLLEEGGISEKQVIILDTT